MKKWLLPAGAALMLLLIVMYPADALSAALASLSAWALSVAPSLLPFLMLTPALTCPETTALFARFAAGLMRLMHCPTQAAGAILVGLMGGSPAGAAAMARLSESAAFSRHDLLRASLLASGASPAFLLSGVAAGMLNAPETGWLLLRSQVAAVFLTGLMLRTWEAGPTESASPAAAPPPQKALPAPSPALAAAQALLSIGGYMALFSVLARLLSRLLGPSAEAPLLALMELAGGCRALHGLPLPLDIRLMLISAVSCFGGASVCAQCLSFLRPMGVRPSEYVLGKLIQALLAGLVTFLQLHLETPSDPWLFSAILAALLLLCVMIHSIAAWRRRPNGGP